MRDLALKYRPTRLSQLIGQADVQTSLSQYLASGSNQSLLLTGPSGTGKTTAARIIAASRTCQGSDAPCAKCGDCQAIFAGSGTFGYTEMNAARFNEARYAKEMSDRITSPSFNHWVTFIDEGHALDNVAQDVLLKAAEEPNSRATFIIATSELLGIRAALRSRCLEIPYRRLRPVECQELLAKVCKAESINAEVRALQMFSVAAEGSARKALNLLEPLVDDRAITAERAARSLALTSTKPLLDLFHAIVAGDAAAQDAALEDWPAEPLMIGRQIRNLLLYLYNFEVASVRRSDIVDPAFFMLTEHDRKPIVGGLLAHARGTDREDFWLALVDLWEINPQTLVDLPSLKMKLYRFVRALRAGGGDPVLVTMPVTAEEPRRAYRGRVAKRAAPVRGSASETQWMDQTQAEAIYDRATFLPQEHGMLFNTHIAISIAGARAVNAKDLIGTLTHELSIRTRAWSCGSAAHWIYTKRQLLDGLGADIILHLPAPALDRVEDWLARRMKEWLPIPIDGNASWSIDAARSQRADGWLANRVQRHWHLVRKLWAGIDPEICDWGHGRTRRTLLDLLQVKRADRVRIDDAVMVQSYGSSRSLGPDRCRSAASDQMAFLSAFRDDAWNMIFAGWELDEHKDRQAEKQRREDDLARIDLEWPRSDNPLEQQARLDAIQRVKQAWATDPKRRLRSWAGWW